MALTYNYITSYFYKTEGKGYLKKIKHVTLRTHMLDFWHVQCESFVIKSFICRRD